MAGVLSPQTSKLNLKKLQRWYDQELSISSFSSVTKPNKATSNPNIKQLFVREKPNKEEILANSAFPLFG
ncbi:MAG: hypothetical protein LBQ02_03655 [Candidatus Nomurabacteria bacterium]|jgi:hypothetical protein|nr:hypothetical protein [Candidatus Nomurabacteria bacterium]